MSRGISAVFDLDGTLLDGDSTTAWISSRVKSCWWRLALAVGVAPAALAMMSIPATKGIGASAFLWTATVGMDEGTLRKSFDDFSLLVSGGSARVGWFSGGVQTLYRHIDAGNKTVIATAAPAWLAEALAARKGFEIPLVGSTLVRRFGGWVEETYCRGVMKRRLLEQAGHGTHWHYAYSDSADDRALFAAASHAMLVNGSERSRAILVREGITFADVTWTGR